MTRWRAAIWLILSIPFTVPTRAEIPPRINVPLNHFFLVLPAPTFDALAASYEWRTLVQVEQRTTTADGESWTGLYLYLDNGYLELLRDGAVNMKAGTIGLAVSVDLLSELETANTRLKPLWPSVQRATRKKQLGDSETPWFDMLYSSADELGIGLPVWVMAYRPEFFRAQGVDVPDGAPLTVRDFERLAPPQAAAKCSRIRTIRLSASSASVDGLGRWLTALGWSATRSLTSADYTQAGITLSLISSKPDATPRLMDTTWSCTTQALKDSQPAPGLRVTEREGSVTWQFP